MTGTVEVVNWVEWGHWQNYMGILEGWMGTLQGLNGDMDGWDRNIGMNERGHKEDWMEITR